MKQAFSGIGSFLQTPFGVILSVSAAFHLILWVVGVEFSYLYIGIAVIVLIFDFVVANLLLDRLI